MKRLASLAMALFLGATSVVGVTSEAQANPYRGYGGYQTPYSRDRGYRKPGHSYYQKPGHSYYKKPGHSYYQKPGYLPGKRVYAPGFRGHSDRWRTDRVYSPYYRSPGYYR
ncbi:MAG: hypothetical protein KME23_28545 [Goleter apudmare HA4340-LM2]|nr:hypothetical protein [Goleter apudmare HA4340-LM2]